MSGPVWRRAALLAAILLIGLGIGLGASFLVWPVGCANASPSDLGPQGRCRWAEAAVVGYRFDADLTRARSRLVLLGEEAKGALCAVADGECRACAPDSALSARLLAQSLAVSCGGE